MSKGVIATAGAGFMSALVFLALVAAPVQAKPRGCTLSKVKAPTGAEEATRLEPARVTGRATEKNPVVVEYDHPASVALFGTGSPNYRYMELLVEPRSEANLLNVHLSWPTPSVSEFDLYLYDQFGEDVAMSTAVNPPVAEAVGDAIWPKGSSGGHGYESVIDLHVNRCETLGLLVEGFWSAGEHMTVKLWFGN